METKVIPIEDIHGKKKSFTIEQKQMTLYRRDYDLRAKAERAQAIAKARDITDHPSRYSMLRDIGCMKYIQRKTLTGKPGSSSKTGKGPRFRI